MVNKFNIESKPRLLSLLHVTIWSSACVPTTRISVPYALNSVFIGANQVFRTWIIKKTETHVSCVWILRVFEGIEQNRAKGAGIVTLCVHFLTCCYSDLLDISINKTHFHKNDRLPYEDLWAWPIHWLEYCLLSEAHLTYTTFRNLCLLSSGVRREILLSWAICKELVLITGPIQSRLTPPPLTWRWKVIPVPKLCPANRQCPA